MEVIPKIVVEVLSNEIQKSPKYKSEMSLRFARINRNKEKIKSCKKQTQSTKSKKIYEMQFTVKEKY